MATVLVILAAAAVVSAAAAGYSAYAANEARQDAAKQNKKVARWQQEVEEAQSQAARKQVELKSRRFLNQQSARAGGAGVAAGEGSLLVNQMEAASLAQYEADLAAYGHDLSAQTHGFESRLFKRQQVRAQNSMYAEVGVATGGSLAGSTGSIATGYK